MKTLDNIVKNVLLQRNYPIHYYMQFLVYARDCYRELAFDDLKAINTTSITLDKYNEAPLPDDFCDIVNVGYGVGQGVRELVSDDNLNTLINYDTNGNRIPYITTSSVSNPRGNYLVGYEGYIPYYSYDYWGVYRGAWFGYNPGYSDTYTIIRSRNVIKINESITGDRQWSIQYIGDGSCCNAATLIDPYAQATIIAYINWQLKENNRTYNVGERQVAQQWYLHERRILRGRKSDLTLDGIKRVIDSAYSLVPKN